MDKYYFMPWCRIPPYLVGILMGYVLHINRKSQIKLPKVRPWSVCQYNTLLITIGFNCNVRLVSSGLGLGFSRHYWLRRFVRCIKSIGPESSAENWRCYPRDLRFLPSLCVVYCSGMGRLRLHTGIRRRGQPFLVLEFLCSVGSIDLLRLLDSSEFHHNVHRSDANTDLLYGIWYSHALFLILNHIFLPGFRCLFDCGSFLLESGETALQSRWR